MITTTFVIHRRGKARTVAYAICAGIAIAAVGLLIGVPKMARISLWMLVVAFVAGCAAAGFVKSRTFAEALGYIDIDSGGIRIIVPNALPRISGYGTAMADFPDGGDIELLSDRRIVVRPKGNSRVPLNVRRALNWQKGFPGAVYPFSISKGSWDALMADFAREEVSGAAKDQDTV